MSTQLRAAWLAAGAVVTVIVLVSMGRVFAGAAVTPERTGDEQTLVHTVSKVVIDSNAGDAVLTTGPAGQVTLERETVSSIGASPEVDQRWEGDVLHIQARCPEGGVAGIGDCAADFTLEVPADADVDLRTEAGTLSVTGITGDVKAASDAGDIELSGLGGGIHARTESGSINGRDLKSARTDVEAQAGDAQLQYVAAPREVRAVTSAGDVSVLVPSGPYAVVASSQSQEATVGFTPDPDAESTITATVQAGSVEVGYTD
ncbi:DUF4097 family beta strand repeat-containing protein [Kineosporia babensis]|uniref:DUF4097 family beta strand repeat-containing protein n=1 Tax=Kineosporia babensis TaxID=499548 RepID=A0A9X1SU36_9ACTN|nr:DUF4097 family beta strand repeat-containing protein [Kineosporia babensis]MCD5312026.1 DUF4097 family beta strand repeat-containing protein [Kineosporia babensis]